MYFHNGSGSLPREDVVTEYYLHATNARRRKKELNAFHRNAPREYIVPLIYRGRTNLAPNEFPTLFSREVARCKDFNVITE